MKTLIFLLSFFYIGNVLCQESLTWNENTKLTWADFKAVPDSQSNAVAMTGSGITFGFSVQTSEKKIVDFSTTVYAHFYPGKSWCLKEKVSEHILNHEQLHFDITELYTRQFRQELEKLQVSQNVKVQIEKLYKSKNKELNKTQQLYDLQTKHSVNVEKQKEWEAAIQKELTKLDAFKSI